MTMRHSVFLSVALVYMLLAACTEQWDRVGPNIVSARMEKMSTFTEVDCATWEVAQSPNQICGLVEVSADHFNLSDNRRLPIPVVIMRADGDAPTPDAIVYLADGPGGVIVHVARSLRVFLFGVAQTRDIVWIEPRGQLLDAADLNCWRDLTAFQQAVFTEALSSDAYADGFFTAVENCMQRAQVNGIDLSLFTARQDAADVVAVARALGYEQVNLYGVGYGGSVALELLRHFNQSDLVRSAVLVSPYDAGINPLLSTLAFATQLEHLLEKCTFDEACNSAFPDLRARFDDTLSKLQERPLLVEAAYDEGVMVPADETILLNYLLGGLEVGSLTIAELPMRLNTILNGDYSSLGEGVYFLRYDRAWGVYVANLCQDALSLASTQEAIEQIEQLPKAMQNFALRRPTFSPRMLDLCQSLGLTHHSVRFTDVVASDVPTLVLTGDFDPVVLPAWSEQATSGLTDRLFVIASQGGHGTSLLLACSTTAVVRFLENPTQTTTGVCEQQPVVFYAPPPPDTLTDHQVVLVQELGIATEVPQLIADEFAETGSYSGLANSGFALTIKRVPVRSLQEAVDLLADSMLAESTQQSLTLGSHTWQVLENPIGFLTMIFAVTQLETGDVYQVEMITDAFAAERAGTTPEQIKESILLPLLEHFRLIDK